MAVGAWELTAALVFLDLGSSPNGLQEGLLRGEVRALLAVGLYTAFSSLGSRAADGWFSYVMNGIGWVFLAMAVTSSAFFVYALIRAFLSSPTQTAFGFGDLLKGVLFTFGVVATVAFLRSVSAIPALLDVLDIELSLLVESQLISLSHLYFFDPFIRRLSVSPTLLF